MSLQNEMNRVNDDVSSVHNMLVKKLLAFHELLHGSKPSIDTFIVSCVGCCRSTHRVRASGTL